MRKFTYISKEEQKSLSEQTETFLADQIVELEKKAAAFDNKELSEKDVKQLEKIHRAKNEIKARIEFEFRLNNKK